MHVIHLEIHLGKVLLPCKNMGVRVAQLEDARTVNHAVYRSSPSCVKLTKSLQQAFNPKIAWFFGSTLKIGGPVYHNNIVGTLKIYFCSSYIGKVLRLPVRITLTVPKVLGTENWVTSSLPSLRCSHSHLWLTANYTIGFLSHSICI